jgi:hypothetical protein
VFPVRYELNFYMLFRRNSAFKVLSTGTGLPLLLSLMMTHPQKYFRRCIRQTSSKNVRNTIVERYRWASSLGIFLSIVWKSCIHSVSWVLQKG